MASGSRQSGVRRKAVQVQRRGAILGGTHPRSSLLLLPLPLPWVFALCGASLVVALMVTQLGREFLPKLRV